MEIDTGTTEVETRYSMRIAGCSERDYDPLDAMIHREVIRQYQNLYEDFVAQHFPTDNGPIWVGGSQAEIELAMREEFENTEKFRLATIWSKDGSRCLSCGRVSRPK